jgi:hypothetical protein
MLAAFADQKDYDSVRPAILATGFEKFFREVLKDSLRPDVHCQLPFQKLESPLLPFAGPAKSNASKPSLYRKKSVCSTSCSGSKKRMCPSAHIYLFIS